MSELVDGIQDSTEKSVLPPMLEETNEVLIKNDQTMREGNVSSANIENKDVAPVAQDGAKQGEDPYAYLKRNEFCSENFKIELKNLPKFYGIQELRKLLNVTLKLDSSKLKSPRRNSPYAFVGFRSDEDRTHAMAVLQDYKWKGNVLRVQIAKPTPDPLVEKRKSNSNAKMVEDTRSFAERLKDSTTPLWNVPYEKQLVRKQDDVKTVLKKIASGLAHQNPGLIKWLEKQKKLHDGLPCELLEIRHGENCEGYRNKCEFTVGIDEQSGLKTVGFRIGSYVNGVTGVGPPDDLRHIPDAMKTAAKAFEKFVRDSDLDVFSPEHQVGQFRQLTARTSRGQLMLVVGVYSKDVPEERVERLKKELVRFFTEGEGKAVKVTSLYYHSMIKRVSNDDSPKPVHLFGETHISEAILGLKFRVSPEAFFQVNTEAAEVLYNSAIELAAPTKESTVVDICCGTGTIGLCFAKECNQVLGVEIVEQAIEDAKMNAKENNIENAEFFAGKAEDILYSTFLRAKNEDVIAIVDPPRAGLHNRAVTMLRKIKNLKKLLYISCDPKKAMKNFTDFGRAESKTMFGSPLVPIKAVAVDLFPHTPHFELVLLFQRIDTLLGDEDK